MRIIIAGATGFSGGEVLRQALLDPEITEIMVLTRRPLSLSSPKVRQVIISNFLDYSGVDFAGYDACIWCLGISQTAVKEQEYIDITYGYTLAAAKVMFAANPTMRFCFLSGRGADQGDAARNLFGRIKGRAERDLSALSSNVISFRPAYIRPTKITGPRKDFARHLAFIGTIMGRINNDWAVDCDQLGRALIGVAKHGASQPVLTNLDIRAWQEQRA